MKKIILLLALTLVVGCDNVVPKNDVDCVPALSAAAGYVVVTNQKVDIVAPDNKDCPYCSYDGWNGDGKIFYRCNVCNPDGTKPKPKLDNLKSNSSIPVFNFNDSNDNQVCTSDGCAVDASIINDVINQDDSVVKVVKKKLNL